MQCVDKSTKTAVRWIAFLAVVMVAYWTLWYWHRTLVASESNSVYVNFENAFPLADGVLTALLIATAVQLRARRPSALLFGLLGSGCGFYLLSMDVLFDLEHGIWSKGAGGIIEVGINLLTLAASTLFARWIWSRRVELLSSGVERTETTGNLVE